MSVGQRIAELRKEHHISQVQLAKLLNVSRQAVSKWENDQSLPDTHNMILLAELLETNIEYLSTGRETPLPSPPITVHLTQTVDKVIEKVVEKPVVTRITRVKYLRNPMEYIFAGFVGLLLGLLLGILIGVFLL